MMWITVARLDELNEYHPFRAEADGEYFALFRDGNVVYCLRDACSHAEVPLSSGGYDRHGKVVTCVQHGAKFDIVTGKALTMPAASPVATYPVRILDGEVQIQVEE